VDNVVCNHDFNRIGRPVTAVRMGRTSVLKLNTIEKVRDFTKSSEMGFFVEFILQ